MAASHEVVSEVVDGLAASAEEGMGGRGGKRGIPSHILMATMNSCWGIARPRLGLGIARSHAPAGGDAMEYCYVTLINFY